MIEANLDQLGEAMARDPEMVEQQRELDLRNAELERLRDTDAR